MEQKYKWKGKEVKLDKKEEETTRKRRRGKKPGREVKSRTVKE